VISAQSASVHLGVPSLRVDDLRAAQTWCWLGVILIRVVLVLTGVLTLMRIVLRG